MAVQADQISPQKHTRINASLLGAVEKRALIWLAARMPAWVVPDTLTTIALVASGVIFLGYFLTRYDRVFFWLASLGFVVQWFGDSLDGTLARYRKIERPVYGFFIDHISDSVSITLIFIGMGLSPYLQFNLALLALIGYLLLSIYVYLATYVNGVFRLSYGRIGPTEMRLIAVVANTLIFFTGGPRLHLAFGVFDLHLTVFDMVAIMISGLAAVFFVIYAAMTARVLARKDPGGQPQKTTRREVQGTGSHRVVVRRRQASLVTKPALPR